MIDKINIAKTYYWDNVKNPILKYGKTKLAIIKNDEIICYLRGYIFGGGIMKSYINITITCGSLKNKSISINPITGKCITKKYSDLTFLFLQPINK